MVYAIAGAAAAGGAYYYFTSTSEGEKLAAKAKKDEEEAVAHAKEAAARGKAYADDKVNQGNLKWEETKVQVDNARRKQRCFLMDAILIGRRRQCALRCSCKGRAGVF
jgi:hypothetical protein